MSFILDTAGSWLKQKKDLERLQGVMGPLPPQQQDLMGQMQQNVQGGLLQHMGNQYMDRIGQRTGLSGFGMVSDQAYKPWEQQGMPQGLLAQAPFQGQQPGGAINVPAGTKGLRSKLASIFAMGV